MLGLAGVIPKLCTWVLHALDMQTAKFGDKHPSPDPAWVLSHLRGVTATTGSPVALVPLAAIGGYGSVFFAETSWQLCMGCLRPVHAGVPVGTRDRHAPQAQSHRQGAGLQTA